jgi:hypothetical protein
MQLGRRIPRESPSKVPSRLWVDYLMPGRTGCQLVFGQRDKADLKHEESHVYPHENLIDPVSLHISSEPTPQSPESPAHNIGSDKDIDLGRSRYQLDND